MKHNFSWFTLMVVSILVILTATGSAEALFFLAAIGLCGALIAGKQHVNRGAILVATVASGLSAVMAIVILVLKHL